MALLEDYKKFLRERGKSENTIKTYSGHVNEYYRWYMDTFGEAPTLLYHTNILDFRSYLQNIKKLKFKSIDTKLSSLTVLMSSWCRLEFRKIWSSRQRTG